MCLDLCCRELESSSSIDSADLNARVGGLFALLDRSPCLDLCECELESSSKSDSDDLNDRVNVLFGLLDR